jgi:hypothetical protein
MTNSTIDLLQKSKKLVVRGVRSQESGTRKAWIIQNPKSKIQNYLTEKSIFARGLIYADKIFLIISI